MLALLVRTAEFLFYHLLLSIVDRVSRLPRNTMMPEAMRLYRENIALKAQLDALGAHLSRMEKPAARLPAHSPNLNAFAERFVLSIKSECLERMVPLGETHLRRAVAEYMLHYHHERNHQGLGNGLIDGGHQDAAGTGAVVRRERLGGLLNFYQREAA